MLILYMMLIRQIFAIGTTAGEDEAPEKDDVNAKEEPEPPHKKNKKHRKHKSKKKKRRRKGEKESTSESGAESDVEPPPPPRPVRTTRARSGDLKYVVRNFCFVCFLRFEYNPL